MDPITVILWLIIILLLAGPARGSDGRSVAVPANGPANRPARRLMAEKREPKHVKALIDKHTKAKAEPKQVIPAATLWHRLRLRKQK